MEKRLDVQERLAAYRLPFTWWGWVFFGFMMVLMTPMAIAGRSQPLELAFAGWLALVALCTLARVLTALWIDHPLLASLLTILAQFPLLHRLCRSVWVTTLILVSVEIIYRIKRPRAT